MGFDFDCLESGFQFIGRVDGTIVLAEKAAITVVVPVSARTDSIEAAICKKKESAGRPQAAR